MLPESPPRRKLPERRWRADPGRAEAEPRLSASERYAYDANKGLVDYVWSPYNRAGSPGVVTWPRMEGRGPLR